MESEILHFDDFLNLIFHWKIKWTQIFHFQIILGAMYENEDCTLLWS